MFLGERLLLEDDPIFQPKGQIELLKRDKALLRFFCSQGNLSTELQDFSAYLQFSTAFVRRTVCSRIWQANPRGKKCP